MLLTGTLVLLGWGQRGSWATCLLASCLFLRVDLVGNAGDGGFEGLEGESVMGGQGDGGRSADGRGDPPHPGCHQLLLSHLCRLS